MLLQVLFSLSLSLFSSVHSPCSEGLAAVHSASILPTTFRMGRIFRAQVNTHQPSSILSQSLRHQSWIINTSHTKMDNQTVLAWLRYGRRSPWSLFTPQACCSTAQIDTACCGFIHSISCEIFPPRLPVARLGAHAEFDTLNPDLPQWGAEVNLRKVEAEKRTFHRCRP